MSGSGTFTLLRMRGIDVHRGHHWSILLTEVIVRLQEERLKVKGENPSYSICEIAKELGRRWADMAPEVKQRYQQMAEEARQKYDLDMASYR